MSRYFFGSRFCHTSAGSTTWSSTEMIFGMSVMQSPWVAAATKLRPDGPSGRRATRQDLVDHEAADRYDERAEHDDERGVGKAPRDDVPCGVERVAADERIEAATDQLLRQGHEPQEKE